MCFGGATTQPLTEKNRPAELIAKFLDEKLRAGNKGTSEEELEGTLDKVLVLVKMCLKHSTKRILQKGFFLGRVHLLMLKSR
ncbi:putative cullin [Helianthus anomalus]